MVIDFIDEAGGAPPAPPGLLPEDSALALATGAAALVAAAPRDRARALLIAGRCLSFKFMMAAPEALDPLRPFVPPPKPPGAPKRPPAGAEEEEDEEDEGPDTAAADAAAEAAEAAATPEGAAALRLQAQAAAMLSSALASATSVQVRVGWGAGGLRPLDYSNPTPRPKLRVHSHPIPPHTQTHCYRTHMCLGSHNAHILKHMHLCAQDWALGEQCALALSTLYGQLSPGLACRSLAAAQACRAAAGGQALLRAAAPAQQPEVLALAQRDKLSEVLPAPQVGVGYANDEGQAALPGFAVVHVSRVKASIHRPDGTTRLSSNQVSPNRTTGQRALLGSAPHAVGAQGRRRAP